MSIAFTSGCARNLRPPDVGTRARGICGGRTSEHAREAPDPLLVPEALSLLPVAWLHHAAGCIRSDQFRALRNKFLPRDQAMLAPFTSAFAGPFPERFI